MSDSSQDVSTNFVIPDKPDNLVNSSSVLGYTYNGQNYTLFVWYKGKKQSCYRYLMCYPTTFAQVFNSGPGIGKKARDVLRSLPSMKVR